MIKICEICGSQESSGNIVTWWQINGEVMLLCSKCAKELQNKDGK